MMAKRPPGGVGAGVIEIRRRATRKETGAVMWRIATASLVGADLRGIDLTDADLHGALLSGCDLREVVLTGADLTGAKLRKTDFRGANLSRANMARHRL